MVLGILMLLIIGFTRLWHFLYVRLDPMLCAMIGVDKLPHATTFWRYVDSLGINQAEPLLKISASMRERVWAHCGLKFPKIHIETHEFLAGKFRKGTTITAKETAR